MNVHRPPTPGGKTVFVSLLRHDSFSPILLKPFVVHIVFGSGHPKCSTGYLLMFSLNQGVHRKTSPFKSVFSGQSELERVKADGRENDGGADAEMNDKN